MTKQGTEPGTFQILWRTTVVLLLAGLVTSHADEPALGLKDNPIKFGFTKSMFMDLNEADARAAVKSYAMLLASNSGLTVSDSPGVIDNTLTVAEAFTKGTADIISLTTTEFLSLPDGSSYPRFIAASMGGSYTEQYVLLVRNDSGFSTVADLKNKRLLIYSSLRGSLSPLWLDVLLASNGLSEAEQFFANVTPVNKPSRTVLPVFFKQADACVVTLNGFQVMSEMNPQVMKQLKVLAVSPEIIPAVTCFRTGMPRDSFEFVIKAVVNAQNTVSGRQVMTIFQCDSLCEITTEQLSSVRALLAAQAKLRHHSSTAGANAAAPGPINPDKTQ